MTEKVVIGDATLYHGDCMDVLPTLGKVDAVVTDPPYGIAFKSSMTGPRFVASCSESRPVSICGDEDTSLRDSVLESLPGVPALVFGTWKKKKPAGVKHVLTWVKGLHLGMGDLSIPWKPNTEEIYVIGLGFHGHRGTSALCIDAPVSWATGGRVHPHEKPPLLLAELIKKCPSGAILDPFMGSGTTGVACMNLGRKFIGIELERKYFDIACERIEQAQRQVPLFGHDEPRDVYEQTQMDYA